MKNKIFTILFIIPLLSFIYLIPSLIKSEYIFFPKNNNIKICPFTDLYENENSEIINFDCNDNIQLNYVLKKGNYVPYVGVYLYYKNIKGINARKYDYLILKIKSTEPTVLYIRYKTFINGYTKFGNGLTYTHSQKSLNINNTIKTYKLKIKDFKIPDWWFSLNKDMDPNNVKANLKNLNAILIQSEDKTLYNTQNTINIEYIGLKNDLISDILLYIVIILSIYIFILLAFLIIKLIKKYKKIIEEKNEIIKLHKPLNIENYSDNEAKKVFNFLKNNYNSQNLSLKMINKETGISEFKIPIIIKKYCKLSFKQYLNLIRLEESKRLLKETDRQIIEIAFYVGYNNVTHFNRVFKEYFKISPIEFRKNIKFQKSKII